MSKYLSDKAAKEVLNIFTREKLRNCAKALYVPRGRNKKDTIKNLIEVDKCEINVTLNWEVIK